MLLTPFEVIMDNLLEMRGICKNFPGVKALDNVDFYLNKGEIHALMGENGAGKSTLIKVLTGVEEFETGQIILEGKKNIINKSPKEAQANGISTFARIFQWRKIFFWIENRENSDLLIGKR